MPEQILKLFHDWFTKTLLVIMKNDVHVIYMLDLIPLVYYFKSTAQSSRSKSMLINAYLVIVNGSNSTLERLQEQSGNTSVNNSLIVYSATLG